MKPITSTFFSITTSLAFLWKYVIQSLNRGHKSTLPFDTKLKVAEESRALILLKRRLYTDQCRVPRMDFGAGSRYFHHENHTIAQLAGISGASRWSGRFLKSLARHLRPSVVLELGTSLGLSTLYLAEGCDPECRIHTIEGNVVLANRAKVNFEQADYDNITVHIGTFRTILPTLLDRIPNPNLIVIDGDHRSDSLLAYVERCLPYLSDPGWIVVDDIRWSPDMHCGWRALRQYPGVKKSIDTYHYGILEMAKGHRTGARHTLAWPKPILPWILRK